jgi:hypothetical protein
MTVQNEVKWLLDIIRSNYPATWPDDLVLRNRDDHVTLYDSGDVREQGVSLDAYDVVSVSSGSTNRELYGTSPQYRVETTVDIRVESKYTGEWGESDSDDDFNTLVAYVQHAINSEITYPNVDTGDEDIGRVEYLDLRIQDENNQSVQDKDYYLTTFTVLLRGNAETP